MRRLLVCLVGPVLLMSVPCAMAEPYPQTRQYLMGDIDAFQYDGPGSADHVYVDPTLWNYANLGSPAIPFDIVADNRDVPFTFLFPLGPGEEITGATLTLALRAAPSGADNDWLCVHPDDGTIHWTYGATHWAGDHYTVYRYDELGWSVPTTGATVFNVDLANIDGDNRLPWLQDGELCIHITDDTAVDYAVLTVTVVPEPASLVSGMVGLGMLAAYLKRQRSHGRRRGLAAGLTGLAPKK